MILAIFIILMIAVFGRLLGFAIRLSWGVFKILLSLVFLPGIIIAAFVLKLFVVAFPILIIAGIISILIPKRYEI